MVIRSLIIFLTFIKGHTLRNKTALNSSNSQGTFYEEPASVNTLTRSEQPSTSLDILDHASVEPDPKDDITSSNFNDDLSNIILKNMVHFYCKANTPLSNASEISKLLINIVNFTTETVKDKILQCATLQEAQTFVKEIEINDDKFRSEYMFKKSLTESKVWFQPKKFVIRNEFVQSIVDMDNDIDMNIYQGIVMPIEDQITTFLQLPGMLRTMMSNQEFYLTMGEDKPISHFCQGKLWKDIIKRNPGKILIPVMIYNDDFKIDDSVGPHSGDNAISGFYYQFPSVPTFLKSKLQYIFVAMLTLSKHIKECTPDSALYMLVNIFTRLEVYGIDVMDELGQTHKVHIILTNVLGDNLGIHTIFGFTTGFNSEFYCRFCITSKFICQHLYCNKDIILRSIDR